MELKLELLSDMKLSYKSYEALAFENENIGIAFIASSEEISGFMPGIPEHKNIGKDIYRVKTDEPLVSREFQNNFQFGRSHFFYYTSDFRINDECSYLTLEADNVSCGSSSIRINNFPLRIYCVVDEEINLQNCDEVVRSMKVSVQNSTD